MRLRFQPPTLTPTPAHPAARAARALVPQDEICGDAVDMLMTIGDFAEFKELMLEHKKLASGGATNLDSCLL